MNVLLLYYQLVLFQINVYALKSKSEWKKKKKGKNVVECRKDRADSFMQLDRERDLKKH